MFILGLVRLSKGRKSPQTKKFVGIKPRRVRALQGLKKNIYFLKLDKRGPFHLVTKPILSRRRFLMTSSKKRINSQESLVKLFRYFFPFLKHKKLILNF